MSEKNVQQQPQQPAAAPAPAQEKHHHLGGMGTAVRNAALWGFGATLGADVANSLVGGVKEEWDKK